MSINEGKDKDDVIHIYNGISAIKRNEFIEIWMDLEETVIQSEVSQKRETQILYIRSYKWDLEKWYR